MSRVLDDEQPSPSVYQQGLPTATKPPERCRRSSLPSAPVRGFGSVDDVGDRGRNGTKGRRKLSLFRRQQTIDVISTSSSAAMGRVVSQFLWSLIPLISHICSIFHTCFM